MYCVERVFLSCGVAPDIVSKLRSEFTSVGCALFFLAARYHAVVLHFSDGSVTFNSIGPAVHLQVSWDVLGKCFHLDFVEQPMVVGFHCVSIVSMISFLDSWNVFSSRGGAPFSSFSQVSRRGGGFPLYPPGRNPSNIPSSSFGVNRGGRGGRRGGRGRGVGVVVGPKGFPVTTAKPAPVVLPGPVGPVIPAPPPLGPYLAREGLTLPPPCPPLPPVNYYVYDKTWNYFETGLKGYAFIPGSIEAENYLKAYGFPTRPVVHHSHAMMRAERFVMLRKLMLAWYKAAWSDEPFEWIEPSTSVVALFSSFERLNPHLFRYSIEGKLVPTFTQFQNRFLPWIVVDNPALNGDYDWNCPVGSLICVRSFDNLPGVYPSVKSECSIVPTSRVVDPRHLPAIPLHAPVIQITVQGEGSFCDYACLVPAIHEYLSIYNNSLFCVEAPSVYGEYGLYRVISGGVHEEQVRLLETLERPVIEVDQEYSDPFWWWLFGSFAFEFPCLMRRKKVVVLNLPFKYDAQDIGSNYITASVHRSIDESGFAKTFPSGALKDQVVKDTIVHHCFKYNRHQKEIAYAAATTGFAFGDYDENRNPFNPMRWFGSCGGSRKNLYGAVS